MTLRPIDGRPKPEPAGVAGGDPFSHSQPLPQGVPPSTPVDDRHPDPASCAVFARRVDFACQILAGFASASRGGTAEQVVTAAYEWADKLLEKA